jgi:hypothetical protein
VFCGDALGHSFSFAASFHQRLNARRCSAQNCAQ